MDDRVTSGLLLTDDPVGAGSYLIDDRVTFFRLNLMGDRVTSGGLDLMDGRGAGGRTGRFLNHSSTSSTRLM